MVFDDTKAESLEYLPKNRCVYIPPFDGNDSMAGQGTIALEI